MPVHIWSADPGFDPWPYGPLSLPEAQLALSTSGCCSKTKKKKSKEHEKRSWREKGTVWEALCRGWSGPCKTWRYQVKQHLSGGGCLHDSLEGFCLLLDQTHPCSGISPGRAGGTNIVLNKDRMNPSWPYTKQVPYSCTICRKSFRRAWY